MRHALLFRHWHHDRGGRFDACRGIQAQQRPTGRDALVNLLQEAWVAHLIADQPIGVLFGAAPFDPGLLRWFL